MTHFKYFTQATYSFDFVVISNSTVSFWLWRFPVVMVHRALTTANSNWSLTLLTGLPSLSFQISISSLTSAMTKSSIEVFPKPKSLNWRRENRLSSSQCSPSVFTIPDGKIMFLMGNSDRHPNFIVYFVYHAVFLFQRCQRLWNPFFLRKQGPRKFLSTFYNPKLRRFCNNAKYWSKFFALLIL